MRIKPVSPADALERVGETIPDYAIQAINDIICAMIADNPNRAYAGFAIGYDVIDAAIHKAARELGHIPPDNGYEWKRFPAIFSEYWDIEVHGCRDAPYERWQFSHYVFRPRGSKIVRDNLIH